MGVNVISYVIIAYPACVLLGFYLNFGVKGLFWGIVLAPLMQVLVYSS